MNAFDYFFEYTSSLDKNFLLGKEELSFTEMFEKSVSLSHIIKRRIGENKNIILISPNNAFYLIAYMAVLKSGNSCIPLDPMIETDSFNYIRELTDSSLIFITNEVQKRLSVEGLEYFTPETLPLYNLSDSEEPNDSFNHHRCAEIIFTSGSTGVPKGVMITHKNLIANTNSIIDYLRLNETDRMLVVLPFYYCYGLSLLHTHLRVGGSIVLNNSFIFLGAVINDLAQHSCTGFAGVPSHFQILLRKSDTFKKTKFLDLKYVTQAGGKLATVFIDEFRKAFPDVKFYVMYGQTEATARLSYLPPEIYESKKGSIGKSIPGVILRVVNSRNDDIKPGKIGEVIAKGDNVMLGYYKDNKSTSYTLRNGWLHTGDLGTIDDGGYIYLTARKKEIIKVGGKRISPKEIEEVILRLPEVVDCTVKGIEDEMLGEAIKAIIVCNSEIEEKMTTDRIKLHCSKHLALHKIPQVIEISDRLVMSSTGKKIKNKL